MMNNRSQALLDFSRGIHLPKPEFGEEESTAVTEGEDRLKYIRPLIEMYGADYAMFPQDLSPDVLADPTSPTDEFNRGVLLEQIASDIDEMFAEALKTVPDLTYEEALSLTQHVAAEGLGGDAEDMANWLFRLAQVLGGSKNQEEGAEQADTDDEVVEEYEEGTPSL